MIRTLVETLVARLVPCPRPTGTSTPAEPLSSSCASGDGRHDTCSGDPGGGSGPVEHAGPLLGGEGWAPNSQAAPTLPHGDRGRSLAAFLDDRFGPARSPYMVEIWHGVWLDRRRQDVAAQLAQADAVASLERSLPTAKASR